MRVGLAYDLKQSVTLKNSAPDDALEEYDSPLTIEYIRKAIESAGHTIVKLGGGREFLQNVLREQVDIVFNISEGRGTHRSREAQVPSVLEMLDIPYTGSDPLCLAVALDKPLTKKLAALDGIITPKWVTVSNRQELAAVDWKSFPFPAIAKPAFEGSSKGVHATSLVDSPDQALTSIEAMLATYQQPVMVEQFIDGDEITVGMVGNEPTKVIGMMRILPRDRKDRFVYSVEVKRDWKNLVDYEAPVKMKKSILDKIEKASLRTFRLLGCRDFARIDFRVSKDGIPYMLEINPLPGLGDYSDLIIMSQKLGWTHESLIVAVFNAALKRCHLCAP
ncbi:MAG: ATP-grasp domain-containing protein, partial [Dehalococcoidales bacterium]|nr:ATP-grasp domain-containing protein [Dehalococcoidales bacterium]